MQNMKVTPEHGAETGSSPSEQEIKTIRWQRQLSAQYHCMMPSFWAPKSVPDTQTERGRNFQCTKNLSLSLSHSNARFSLSLVLSSQHWYVSGCCKLCWLVDVNSCWVREYSRYSVSLDISRHPITSFKPCTPHPFLLHGPTYLWYFITLSEQSYWKLNYLLNYSEKSLPFGILRRLSQHSLPRRHFQTTAMVWTA